MEAGFSPYRKIYSFSYSLIFILILGSSALPAQDWIPFEKALEQAVTEQKPVVVDVWAPWCGWCRKMEQDTYPNLPEKLSSRFIFTRLNRENNDSEFSFRNMKASPLRIAQRLNVDTVPATVVLSPKGDYLFHISGFVDDQKLTGILTSAQDIYSEWYAE